MAQQPTSAARPKRSAEAFARSQESSTKKPRFDYRNPSTLAPDAPEEDLILDADVIGKSGTQTKRNAVNIDGYESDSDADNFNERAAEREKLKQQDEREKGSKDEEEDDMFADLEEADGDEDEEVTGQGKRKKDVKFLDQSEIEGQILSSKSGGHVGGIQLQQKATGRRRAEQSEESESSSGEDEDRDQLDGEMEDEFAAEVGAGGKKRHAPRLDAFNLQQEEEEGRYDESGNYVRKAVDPDALNDNWLDGLSKRDIKRAREAQEKRDDQQRQKAAADDAMLTSELLSTLIAHLETGETPLECLQRLNKGKPKDTKVPKWKQKKQRNGMDVDPNGAESETISPGEAARKHALDAVTGAADALFSREQLEIYETEREMLMRQFKRETGEEWQQQAVSSTAAKGGGEEGEEDAMWEYRWSDVRDGGEEHGPYDAGTMKAWNEAGYFGEGVEFRRVGGGDEWSRVLDVR